MAIVLADSYSESNFDLNFSLRTDSVSKYAQTFSGADGDLDSVFFYLETEESPAGTLVAKIYNITGTHGTDAIPTGSALAVSDSVDISTLTDTPQLIEFSFSGGNRITLESGTEYAVAIEIATGTINFPNRVHVGGDLSANHAGNYSNYNSSWAAGVSSRDICFYVYVEQEEEEPTPGTITGISSVTGVSSIII